MRHPADLAAMHHCGTLDSVDTLRAVLARLPQEARAQLTEAV